MGDEMENSIEQQKKYLKDNLELEALRFTDDNRDTVKMFEQATKGKVISDYLIKKAWEDDEERNTKVFLIKDKNTKEIAFYFAINCGILFSELDFMSMGPEEKKIFDKYVEAMRLLKRTDLSEEEMNSANNQYNDSMIEFWNVVENPDRVTMLIGYAEEKVQLLDEKGELFSNTSEVEHVQPVKETFPAIDIKYWGRNGNYKVPIKLDFRLGVYVFWEIMVPHLLKISENVGCKYIYLFAADNSEKNEKEVLQAPMWTPDYDPDDEDEFEENVEIHKLVNYYIRELKFRYVTKYKILKPHFERTCFTLVQDVNDLQLNRERVWASHIAEEEINN